MKEAGFEITIAENAAEGFYRAVDEQPDCVVCDVDLPDHDGYWVAKKIRSHPSKIAAAPFVFLSGLDDREHRLEGFQVGGDAYLTKPFRIDEVVAQVDALIQMAARVRQARTTLTSVPPTAVAMSGDLSQMSAGTLLTLLDLERRRGVLELKSAGRVARISIANGQLVGAVIDESETAPLDAVRKAVSWTVGKFSFTPSSDDEPPPTSDATPITAVLMEAARLEDEEQATKNRHPSSTRLASIQARFARTQTPRPFPAAGSVEPGPFSSRPGAEALFESAPPSSIPVSLAPFSVAPESSPDVPPPPSLPPPSSKPPALPPLHTPPTLKPEMPPLELPDDFQLPPIPPSRPAIPPARGQLRTPTPPRPIPATRLPSIMIGGAAKPSASPTTPTTPQAAVATPAARPVPSPPLKKKSLPPPANLQRAPNPPPAAGRPAISAPVAPAVSEPAKPIAPAVPIGPTPATPAATTTPLAKPTLPKTGFNALRSLSPARGIRAVTPPAAPASGTADAFDKGWSTPPGSDDELESIQPDDEPPSRKS